MALPAAMVLSGLPQEQFTGNLKAVFNHGTVLLRSPSSSSITSTYSTTSTSPSSESSTESGFFSLSMETETQRSLDYFLDVIEKLEQRFQVLLESKNHECDENEYEEPKIIYHGRNLLDLAGNLKTGWNFQEASLEKNLSKVLEYELRASGLVGEEEPPEACKDCGFEEPSSFGDIFSNLT